MSQAEIHYLVAPESRESGDVEAIANAIGAYQNEIPFPRDRDYEFIPNDAESGAAFLVLNRKTADAMYDHDLREVTERMRIGVEKHFPEAERSRLAGHFSGIAIKDAIFTE